LTPIKEEWIFSYQTTWEILFLLKWALVKKDTKQIKTAIGRFKAKYGVVITPGGV